jgi:Outer membrane protein beta-barrel domain
MKKYFALILSLACCATVSVAQTSSDHYKFEVSSGFSHNRVDTGIGDDDPDIRDVIDERTGFNGFNVAATGNVTRYVGIKFEFSAHFNSKDFPINGGSLETESRLYTFVGGVQLKDNSRQDVAKPFGHALFGVARGTVNACLRGFTNDIPPCGNEPRPPGPRPFFEETGFTAVIGGGLDLRVSEHFSVRTFQLDYNPTRLGDETQHNFRVGAGLVFH